MAKQPVPFDVVKKQVEEKVGEINKLWSKPATQQAAKELKFQVKQSLKVRCKRDKSFNALLAEFLKATAEIPGAPKKSATKKAGKKSSKKVKKAGKRGRKRGPKPGKRGRKPGKDGKKRGRKPGRKSNATAGTSDDAILQMILNEPKAKKKLMKLIRANFKLRLV